MSKIIINDKELFSLKKAKLKGREANFYFYEGKLFKKYKTLFEKKSDVELITKRREEKCLALLKREDLSDLLVLPTDIVYDEQNNFIGYLMPYYDTLNMAEYFRKNKKDKEDILNKYIDISKILEKLHQKGILLHDFRISNVLMLEDGYKFCDADSYCINGIGATMFTSIMVPHYHSKKQKIKETKTFDKEIILINILTDYYKLDLLVMWDYEKYNEELKNLLKKKKITEDEYNELLKLKLNDNTLKYPHEFLGKVKKKK